MRADSGFYTHAIVAVAANVRFSITIRSTPACAISSSAMNGLDAHSLLDGGARWA